MWEDEGGFSGWRLAVGGLIHGLGGSEGAIKGKDLTEVAIAGEEVEAVSASKDVRR